MFGCGSNTGCLTTTTTINNSNCKNPIVHLLYDVIGLTTGPLGPMRSSSAEVLDRILDKGIFIQGECEMCCPDCDGLYFFASVETSLKMLYGSMRFQENNQQCAHDSFYINTPTCNDPRFCGILKDSCGTVPCCTGFQEAFDELICLSNRTTSLNGFSSSPAEVLDRFLDKGIVEYGTINGESQLKHAIRWLGELNYWEYVFYSSYAEVFDRFLDKGLVVKCDKENSGFLISSVETFLRTLPCENNIMTYESTGEGPCCLNIKASVETYNRYLLTSQCECSQIPA